MDTKAREEGCGTFNPKPLPSQQYLRSILSYDPETGALYWKKRTANDYNGNPRKADAWNRDFAGKRAFNYEKEGYYIGTIGRNGYRAHRIIWKMLYNSEVPLIDHINGMGTDNRASNLREATYETNGRNCKLSKRSTSGICGVNWSRSSNCWLARIKVDHKDISLGCYALKQDAIVARKAAEQKYGFHPNHGRATLDKLMGGA